MPLLVFTHVPKTAGASLTARMTRLVPYDRMFVVSSDEDTGEQLRKTDLSGIQYVGGHLRSHIARDILGPAAYMSALRDPVERILSHFFFVVREGGFRLDDDGDMAAGFERFYETAIRTAGRVNLQCRFFSEDGTAGAAIEVIRSHYRLVWDSSLSDAAWPIAAGIASRALGVPLPPEDPGDMEVRAHVAPVAGGTADLRRGARPRSYGSFLTRGRIADLAAENGEDVALFAWLRNRHSGMFRRGSAG